MARGSSLSTSRGGTVTVGSEIRDSLYLLDVLYADHFEEDAVAPSLALQTEENFYRGAPPNWLNFHIREQAELTGTGTCFVKRDGYDKLKQQIQKQRNLPAISTVQLFHQSGSGGTTLAMQVLWDLRKTFRCAALTGSASDISLVAEQVVELFTAGSSNKQNTVLLLLNDEQISDKLQERIMMTIAEFSIVTRMPVVIFLSCVRKDALPQQSQHVVLKRELSDTEKKQFDEKKRELETKFGEKAEKLHGFNIMQTNFSEDYIKQACTVFSSSQRTNRRLKTQQLAAFLALLNAYVPGSYLLESQCLDFLWENSIDENMEQPLLEERMHSFGDLIITFQQSERPEKKVRMAHPMIAKSCTELLHKVGVPRSDTARNFLNNFCSYEMHELPQCLIGFIKDMLTKREAKITDNNSDGKEDQERFSRLILDIQNMESKHMAASVLKVASKKFDQNPLFPQALARFYYIELKHYGQAKRWVKLAMERDPQSSFIADTLGQVYKNQLKNEGVDANQRHILLLAKRAIEAFKHEERLAEEEQDADMKGDGKTKVSYGFNYRGQFGFLQVCNILYDLLVAKNDAWRGVLTNNGSFCSALETLGDTKLYRFDDLIRNLREEVERKSEFVNKHLTYSKHSKDKDYPEYMSKDTSNCHRKYVGDFQQVPQPVHPIQKLKQNLAATCVGVLSSFDRECSEEELKEITEWWKTMCSSKDSGTAVVILACIMLTNTDATFSWSPKLLKMFKEKIPLRDMDPPEEHMLALLLYWPTDNEDKEDCPFDPSRLIQQMQFSYEHAYKKYFRSRYLRPLFFIGKGKDLNRIVHRTVLENTFDQNHETNQDWRNEIIFKDDKVQEHLLKFEGEVRHYKLYATVGGTQIEIEANLPRNLWISRQVSFYLGFTIRGPVAFGIQTKKPDKEMNGSAVHTEGAAYGP